MHLADDLDASPPGRCTSSSTTSGRVCKITAMAPVGIGGLADNGDRTADLGLDTGTEHGVIIDDDHRGTGPRWGGLAACDVGCEVGCLVVSVIS